ncbi:hypothetical protein niasHT_016372 [Heterodera trifolii]|uniref:Uncharacterized protein n=1 Tax=Heterodera trifolii TaxID=157864 RepID=A0ABD2KZ41_9BILA
MHSYSNFEAVSYHALHPPFRGCSVPASHAATVQSIPPFFVDFLHRLHRMVNEYSAELSHWSGGMRFSASQRALYGAKFTATPPPATKGRPRRAMGATARTEKSTPNDSPTERRHSGQQQKRTDSLLKPKENLQEIRAQHSESAEGVKQNISPELEHRKFSSRRRVAVHPPLSISDRIRRTFAPENLAIAANEQMPLETLEQTLAETLPESITESGNYADFLRKYLEDFERELENDQIIIGPISKQQQQMQTDGRQNGQNSTQNNDGIGQRTDNESSVVADSFDTNSFTVIGEPDDKHNATQLPTRNDGEGRAVQPTTVTPPNATVIDAIGRKRTRPSSHSAASFSSSSAVGSPRMSPHFRWKILKRCEKQSETEGTSTAIDEGGEEEKERLNWMLTPPQPTQQSGAGGDRTPLKSFPYAVSSPSGASSPAAPISPLFSISTVKVLEHGRIEFKTPPSAQKTPTKSKSPADDKLLMATPKLLSTRHVFCTLSSTRRPRKIAPQKGGVGESGEKTRGEEEEKNGESDGGDGMEGEKQRKKANGREEEEDGMDNDRQEENREEEDGRGMNDGGETISSRSMECKRWGEGRRSPTNVPRRSTGKTAEEKETINDGNGRADHGKITALELDDELIGDVLNLIHAESPEQ